MINNTIEIKSVLKNGTYTEGKEIGSGSSGTITEIFPNGETPLSGYFVVKHFDSADDNTFRDDCFKEVSNLLLIKDKELPGVLKLLDVVVYEAVDRVDHLTGPELEKLDPDDDTDIMLPGVGIILPRMDCDLMTSLESGNLKAAHKAKIFTDILLGVASLHAAGIIHHDLKTENVLVSYEGSGNATKPDVRAVICDLSFAEVATEPRKISTSGTCGYMAPECVYAEEPAWFAKDIWSVGCIALELFGKIIPEELNDEESLKFVIAERDKLGSGVFPELIKKILCENQNVRPTAMDLILNAPNNVKSFISEKDIATLRSIEPIRLPDIRILLPKKFPKDEKCGKATDKMLRHNVLYYYNLFEAVNPSCIVAAERYYKAAHGTVPIMYCVVAAMKVYDGSEVPDVEFIREEAVEDYNPYVAYMYEYEIMKAMNFQMWII